ncbi:hypothetical protein FQA39_LY19419 [Lamprigera yunnana]|nr:hypothetical protein FQA39_LY19419 [Lamprigera yunnana]
MAGTLHETAFHMRAGGQADSAGPRSSEGGVQPFGADKVADQPRHGAAISIGAAAPASSSTAGIRQRRTGADHAGMMKDSRHGRRLVRTTPNQLLDAVPDDGTDAQRPGGRQVGKAGAFLMLVSLVDGLAPEPGLHADSRFVNSGSRRVSPMQCSKAERLHVLWALARPHVSNGRELAQNAGHRPPV